MDIDKENTIEVKKESEDSEKDKSTSSNIRGNITIYY